MTPSTTNQDWREIPISTGRLSVVDDEDYKNLITHKWCFCNGYAITKIEGKNVRMHRLILNPPKGMMVDHINGNGLDNRKSNLRVVYGSRNQWNRPKGEMKTNTSGSTGVYPAIHRSGAWYSQIYVNDKRFYLGTFITKDEAIRAYKYASQVRNAVYDLLVSKFEKEKYSALEQQREKIEKWMDTKVGLHENNIIWRKELLAFLSQLRVKEKEESR